MRIIPRCFSVGGLSVRGLGPFHHRGESTLGGKCWKVYFFEVCLAPGSLGKVCPIKMCRLKIEILIFIRRQENTWWAWKLKVSNGGDLFCWEGGSEKFLLPFSVAWKGGSLGSKGLDNRAYLCSSLTPWTFPGWLPGRQETSCYLPTSQGWTSYSWKQRGIITTIQTLIIIMSEIK